jgi:hypothetical protein
MNPKTGMDIPRFPAFPQDRIEVWAATVTLGGAKRWSRLIWLFSLAFGRASALAIPAFS